MSTVQELFETIRAIMQDTGPGDPRIDVLLAEWKKLQAEGSK